MKIIKDLLKFTLNQIFAIYGFCLKKLGVIDFVLPPNSNMRRTSAKTIKRYIYSGITTSLPIYTAALLYNVKLGNKIKVLDFGCGVAGQIRVFVKKFPNPKFYACDIDPSSISFLNKYYPTVNSKVNNFNSRLPYTSNFFDFVYSVSTFSHFDNKSIDFYVNELSRILIKNGILIITFESDNSIKSVSNETNVGVDEIKRILKKDGIFFKKYHWLSSYKKNKLFNETKLDMSSYFGDEYGSTICTTEYIKKMFIKKFEFVGHAPGVSCDRQDLLVFKKK